jgi:hypothetical protein
MNGKGCRRKRSWPNLEVLFWNSPGGTEENFETPQDVRSLGLDLNPGPPEYKAGMLIS